MKFKLSDIVIAICVVITGWTIGSWLKPQKIHYDDGAIICVVAGAPDVQIFSPKIRYLGNGEWEFLTGVGKMSVFSKGSMSSCFIAHRPQEETEGTAPIRKAPSPAIIDEDKHDI